MSERRSSGKGKDDEKVVVGRVSGVYGVKGWLKVYSDTAPRAGIAQYSPWFLRKGPQGRWIEYAVESARPHAKTVIAKLEGCNDRDEAMALAGALIAIDAGQLPALDDSEYYWRELVGLRVFNLDEVELGTVERLLETGANDVLVVKAGTGTERLIPWTVGDAIQRVELAENRLIVDWDPDF